MLKELIVKDFAIIEDLSIQFQPHMNALTGETGAGKSLLIDTIELLAGSRADQDMIRYGAKKAYIKGVFTSTNSEVLARLTDLGVKDSAEIIIEREITANSKNIIKVNGINLTLVELKELTRNLIDLHVQHDLYRLLNKENYLTFIDDNSDTKLLELKNKYLLAFEAYKESYKSYKNLLNNAKTDKEKLDYLTYELNELKGLNLELNEDVKIKEEIQILKNYDKIYQSLNKTYELLNGETLDNLYDALSTMGDIQNLADSYSEYSTILNDSYYGLDDLKSKLYQELSHLDFDSERYEYLQNRDYELQKVTDKYKKSVNELISYIDNLTFEIEKITNYDGLLQKFMDKLAYNYEKLLKIALSLSAYRQDKAKLIEKRLVKEACELDLKDINFRIEFKNVELDMLAIDKFKDDGIDEIDFLVSFNKGEPLHSLAKVASGGELSRVMLAFKATFNEQRNLSLMVFDEIDTGVSGEAALMIAKKIKHLGTITQVLCITHLPQVASIADNQFYIGKSVEDNRTKTYIKEVEGEERILAIAKMLSGNLLSTYALEHAKELLNNK